MKKSELVDHIMNTPMATPQVPQDFLELSIKYEYFKRNTAMQAHLNVCKLVDCWASKGPYKEFPEVNPKNRNNPRQDLKRPHQELSRENMVQPGTSSSSKKARMEGPIEEKRTCHDLDNPTHNPSSPASSSPDGSSPDNSSPEPPDRDAPDTDSDDREVFSEKPDDSDQHEQCTLKKTRNLYAKFGGEELKELKRNVTFFSKLMCLQRIANVDFIHLLQSTFGLSSSLRIVNGYRKLTMFVLKPGPYFVITYMSSEEGCLIWYGDELKVDKTIKYQSLAALDFYYLTRDTSIKFAYLEFDIEPYRKCDPAIWPFDSYYFKLQKYLTNIKLDVQSLNITIPNNRGNPANGKYVLIHVYNFLKPDHMREMKIRVWDDLEVARRRQIVRIEGELLEVLYEYDHWRNMKKLDFAGPQIKIDQNNFGHFMHFDTVHELDQNDLEPLLAAYNNPNRRRITNHVVTFFVNDKFRFRTALRVIGHRVGSVPNIRRTESIHHTFKLDSGAKMTLQERQRWILCES